MSQIPFRGNLQPATFPLLSRLAGRTIIDPQADQTWLPNMTTEGQIPKDRGAPSIYYAHNIMPSTYGWQSVDYNTVYMAPSAEEAAVFQDLHFVQCTRGGEEPSPTGTKTYIAIGETDTEAFLYVLDSTEGNWRRITGGFTYPVSGDPIVIPKGCTLTSTTLNGVTFFYVSGIGCFLYDDTIDSVLYRELNGLDPVDIEGIVGSNGYMLAWTANSVAWSSSVDIEDFEPSDISGAGGGSVQEAKGRIIVGMPTVHGVIFMTDANAVSAVYSGNEEYPWNFKEVPGAGGVANAQQISREQFDNAFYAFTTNGIQQISHLQSKTVLPHVADFIGGGIFEDFDIATNTFTEVDTGAALPRQVAVIADRYVILSYGKLPSQGFTHAVALDLVQGRYGKLRIPHVRCFERCDLTYSNVDNPKELIAFLGAGGQCKALDFGFNKIALDAVLILGKFQYVRSRRLELQEFEVETVKLESEFDLEVWSSPNGKSLGTLTTGYLLDEAEGIRRYLLKCEGVNHLIMMKGTLNLQSYVLWSSLGARY